MTSQILFRSLKSSRNRIWNSHKSIRQRGSSWSHLRPYVHTDDIRDIAWNKTKPDGLSVRERENNGEFEIITYWESSPYDMFYLENPHESKKSAIEKAKNTIEMSARFAQYPYRSYCWAGELKNLIAMKPKNALIFICNVNLDSQEKISTIAYHNDLIYLDLFHPFEADPETNLLFSWQVIDLNKYIKAYLRNKEILKNTIKKMRGNYISLSTKEDISTVLNTFFKKRYKNG